MIKMPIITPAYNAIYLMPDDFAPFENYILLDKKISNYLLLLKSNDGKIGFISELGVLPVEQFGVILCPMKSAFVPNYSLLDLISPTAFKLAPGELIGLLGGGKDLTALMQVDVDLKAEQIKTAFMSQSLEYELAFFEADLVNLEKSFNCLDMDNARMRLTTEARLLLTAFYGKQMMQYVRATNENAYFFDGADWPQNAEKQIDEITLSRVKSFYDDFDRIIYAC